MSGHTPGPWEVRERFYIGRKGRMSLAEVVAGGENLACVKSGDAPPSAIEEHEANARLIAAAPDLLAACEGLLWPNVPSGDDVAILVRMCGTTSSQEGAMVLVERLRAAQTMAKAAIARAKGETT